MIGCTRAGFLTERRACGLNAAEALRLEDHLSSCERCAEQSELLAGLRTLATSNDFTLSSAMRERAMRSALSQAREARPSPSLGSGARFTLAVVGSLALAGAVALGLRSTTPSAPALSSPKTHAAAAHTDRVLAGEVETDDSVARQGSALAAATTLRAPRGATLALAQATVVLAAGSEARWDATLRTLHLQTGSVFADVDESAHAQFTIATPRFTVLVLGTRFHVSLDAVSVERGRVRVVAPDGSVLAQAVSAGERYVYRETDRKGAKQVTEEPKPEARRTSTPVVERRELSAVLREVREHLAARRLDQARTLLDQTAALPGTAKERADAMSLRADTALLAGDLDAAITSYLQTARRFRELAAGENALFAAARLEAERDRKAASAKLLERYLARYPHGRFVEEARSRLSALASKLDRKP